MCAQFRWFEPAVPVASAERSWLEEACGQLIRSLGTTYFARRTTVLPKPEYFPDKFRGDETSLERLVSRVCIYLEISAEQLEVYQFSESNPIKPTLPEGSTQTEGSAGRYHPVRTDTGKLWIGINTDLLADPAALVATIAHELCHFLLFEKASFANDRPDNEPITDLLVILTGFGVFQAQAAYRFSQWTGYDRVGWQMSRRGYLSEPLIGYGLAVYSWLKHEPRTWERLLPINVRTVFRKSQRYLERNPPAGLERLESA